MIQVQEAVHGVTLEECQAALQNHSWNVQKAVHYLKVSTRGALDSQSSDERPSHDREACGSKPAGRSQLLLHQTEVCSDAAAQLKSPRRSSSPHKDLSCNNLSAPPPKQDITAIRRRRRAPECHCYFIGSYHMTAAILCEPVGKSGSPLQRVGPE